MVTSGVVTQAEFAADVGVSQQAVSDMLGAGVLLEGQGEAQWLLAYCHRLREQAAGRLETGILSLSQERAALAREQRMGIEIKNAVARGQYASIALLAEVLATASQSVAERFEQIPGMLKKTCADLTDAQLGHLMTALAGARNEWVRATAELVTQGIESTDDDAELIGMDDEPRAD